MEQYYLFVINKNNLLRSIITTINASMVWRKFMGGGEKQSLLARSIHNIQPQLRNLF